MSVNHNAGLGGIKKDIFSIFFNMMVYLLSSESPRRGDSNEYTQYAIYQYKKRKSAKLSQICMGSVFPRDSRTSSIQPW